jgi:triacylglycerol lipase
VVEFPVVLTPGFGDTSRVLEPLAALLCARGFRPILISPQPSDCLAPIEQLAEQLAAAIDRQIPHDQPFHFFGFSMGGLIGRVYWQDMAGDRPLQRFVTLATPHRGSWSAYLHPQRPGCRQMRPGSPFLTALNRDLSRLAAVEFTSLWTPLDVTILPASSSLLPVGVMRQIWAPLHGLLLFDHRVLQVVVDVLAGEEPAG